MKFDVTRIVTINLNLYTKGSNMHNFFCFFYEDISDCEFATLSRWEGC